MANYFYADIGNSTSVPNLILEPIQNADAYIWFNINSNSYQLTPGSKLKTIIVPNGSTTLPDPIESFSINGIIDRLRSDTFWNDDSYGVYSFVGGIGDSNNTTTASFSPIKINNIWENTPFNLHWLLQRGSTEIYGSMSGVYSFPHNIQNNEVVISGSLISDDTMQYNINWLGITNSGDVLYAGSGPYRLKVLYNTTDGDNPDTTPNLSDWVYYPSIENGITFTVPFNDKRLNQSFPALYNFYITNISADSSLRPGSSDKIITINHYNLVNSDQNSFRNLDNLAFTYSDTSQLTKVDSINIPANIIDRRRLSIGINDISIKDNTYVKQGVYVSPYYPLDFSLYTISIKSYEKIPEYPNINPYDVIQYFIEYNSKWERISPINRRDELSGENIIPKILVFDQGESNNSQVKYIGTGNIRIFRVKIVFDLSGINDDKFIPPEIYDYKCIVFDKDQLNEL